MTRTEAQLKYFEIQPFEKLNCGFFKIEISTMVAVSVNLTLIRFLTIHFFEVLGR